jgi:hypothetical protein
VLYRADKRPRDCKMEARIFYPLMRGKSIAVEFSIEVK